MTEFKYNIGDEVTAKKDYIEYKYNKSKRKQIAIGKYFSSGDKFKIARIQISDGFYDKEDMIFLFNPHKFYSDKDRGNMGFVITEFNEYFITLAEYREQQINSILDEKE